MTTIVEFTSEFIHLLLKGEGDHNARDNFGRSIIFYIACYRGFYPTLWNLLLESDDIPREDKIDALEMAGAVLLDKEDKTEEDVALAFQYWRQALTLRSLMDTEDRPMYKAPLKSKNGSLSEWSTEDDLLRIELDPSQHEMQSLLVRLRICSSFGWMAFYKHVHPSMQMLISMGLNGERPISQILNFSWILFDTLLRTERPHESDLDSTLCKTVFWLVIIFKNLLRDDPNFNSENLQKILEIMLMTHPSYFEPLYVLVQKLSKYPEILTEDARLLFIQLVHRDSRDLFGRNLLLRACASFDSDTSSTIRLLVNFGADVNSRDYDGNGVLHYLALQSNGEIRDTTARLLLELGAHLDLADIDGKTAADYWLEKNKPKTKLDLPDWLQEGVPMLKCLLSRVIRRHRIPYKEDNILPVVLVPFVSWH